MARKLAFSIDGVEFSAELIKVDREKLYGGIEIEAFDENGKECSLQVLASDGKTFIGVGGTANAVLTEDGDWFDRKNLTAVNAAGDEIEPVESSFSAANALETATVDEYLSHIVKLVYLLAPPSAEQFSGEPPVMAENVLSPDAIYKFPFSYRGGLEYDTAFIITNEEGTFMIVGTRAELEFVALPQAAVLPETAEEQELDEDELDFDLL